MVADRLKVMCGICNGLGRVVDERQAGDPVATCMTCKGNGWVYADPKPSTNTVHKGWNAPS
jgi:DnaJ-class molecular chaperone